MTWTTPRTTLTCLLLSMCVPSCGNEDPDMPSFNLNGTWDVTETVIWTEGACPLSAQESFVYIMAIAQWGGRLSLVPDGAGNELAGTQYGVGVEISGSYPFADTGTRDITGTDLAVTGNGARFEGTMAWRWTDVSSVCNGRNAVLASRRGGTNPNPIPVDPGE